jgi:hypothetical protein
MNLESQVENDKLWGRTKRFVAEHKDLGSLPQQTSTESNAVLMQCKMVDADSLQSANLFNDVQRIKRFGWFSLSSSV